MREYIPIVTGAVLGTVPLAIAEAIEPSTDPLRVIPLAVVGIVLGTRLGVRWVNHRRNHVLD
jgi:hypothetical protein